MLWLVKKQRTSHATLGGRAEGEPCETLSFFRRNTSPLPMKENLLSPYPAKIVATYTDVSLAEAI